MSLQSPLRRLFLILGVLAAVASGATAIAQEAPFAIAIDTLEDVPLGSSISIPVMKLSGADPIFGFDFLIRYDPFVLTFSGATPGPVFDIPGGNEWESFSFSADSGGSPGGLVHAVAVADIANGAHHPGDYHLADSAVLFTLEFTVTLDSTYECNDDPILFYWTDCGDNMLALDSLGSSLGISSRVYERFAGFVQDITNPTYGFPGSYGAPDSCLSIPGLSRQIDFYGGSVNTHCSDVIDNTGDINCNGLAYEIADFVMFTNYFIYGPSAFDNHLACSQQASDVNFDGNELQWEDLIYVYRVIEGDAYPAPGPFPLDTAAVTFTQDDDAKTVTLDYPDSLAGLLLVFNGEITPTININPEGYISDYLLEGGRTIVLIMPDASEYPLPSQFVVDGPILTYTGSALLSEAHAADFNDRVFHARILSSGGDVTVPFAFDIGEIPNTAPGNIIQIPVVKTNGSEAMSGFDFLIGYDPYGLLITDVSPGAIFGIYGDYQWEYFNYRFGPFDCTGDCPSGLVRVIGLAETADGSHHPLQTNIPDGTTLFSLFGTVTADQTYSGLFIPASFFWIDCGDNGVAFGAIGDSLALSDHVYSVDGSEITDPEYGLPGYYGAPGSCFDNGANPPLRFADFKNGGVHITHRDSMELVLTFDTVSANLGDTAVYVDVHLSNPHDSIAGFELTVMTNRPNIIAFGASPEDTTAFSVENTLIEDWEFVAQGPLMGGDQQVKIVGLADMPPVSINPIAIPPGFNGLLCRLIVHVYDTLPALIEDSTVILHFSKLLTQTDFSDPQGNLVGVVDGAYDSSTVMFGFGSINILVPLDGDANGDGAVDVADAVYLISYIFKSGAAPEPLENGDANCDGEVDIADAVYLITYIFKSGSPPCSP